MEIQIKRAVKAGNSSAVILPRAWLNREVRIELVKKTHETILIDVVNLLKEYMPLSEIIGIYLTGSYARGEETENSDIDILVISESTNRETINKGIYNILIVSEELLEYKLKNDLLPVGQMIREAKPLLNADYIKGMEIKVNRKNVKWYLETTEEKIKLIKRIIDNAKNKRKVKLNDRIAYTLVLRIRTLYIIKNMIKNEDYSNKEFVKLIKYIAGVDAYSAYLSVKNSKIERKTISVEDVDKLCDYLNGELGEIKIILK